MVLPLRLPVCLRLSRPQHVCYLRLEREHAFFEHAILLNGSKTAELFHKTCLTPSVSVQMPLAPTFDSVVALLPVFVAHLATSQALYAASQFEILSFIMPIYHAHSSATQLISALNCRSLKQKCLLNNAR